MKHAASAIADLYDNEQDLDSDRPRREAPDWGGDDLFTSTPSRRRFDRPVRGEHASDRMDRSERAERLDRPRRFDTMEHPLQRPQRPETSAQLARPAHPLELPDIPERTVALPEASGRRTVTITGHPDAARRRPAPTIDERFVGKNPERIAMYAFALGLLLIVIAFLSAGA